MAGHKTPVIGIPVFTTTRIGTIWVTPGLDGQIVPAPPQEGDPQTAPMTSTDVPPHSQTSIETKLNCHLPTGQVVPKKPSHTHFDDEAQEWEGASSVYSTLFGSCSMTLKVPAQ